MIQNDSATGAESTTIVHTGSIGSTVDLDYVSNLAHKVYHPTPKVRLLYWLAFQAPFPYVANHAALEAARQRRMIVDVLTKYWFGHHLVARVVDIEDTPGGAHDFVTQLVRGAEPARKKRAWRFLKLLDRKFLEAGLPTWQVTPYNPHAITNFIERPDGTYRIIDLESSLVSLLYPVTGIWRLMRHGLFPSFDDIDVVQLRKYLQKHGPDISATLTEMNVGEEYQLLLDAVDGYEAAAAEWHAAEPRYLNRFLQALVGGIERAAAEAALRPGFIARGQAHAEQFVRHGVETWHQEGRIDATRAEALVSTLDAPRVETAMLHLGAHFALSLPLRFPFGATARLLYTLALRLRAELNALLRKGSASDARRMHTPLVMLVALLPGFGRLAYFFSPALREERLLLVIPLDQASRHLPFRVYRRLHLDALFLYWGLGNDTGQAGSRPRRWGLLDAQRRLWQLRPYALPITAVIAVNATALLIGLVLFLDSGRQTTPPIWWFREGGLLAMTNSAQLLLGAAFGIAAYRAFWKIPGATSRRDAAGIFFWGIGGIGLAVFAVDDFLTIHERFGDWLFVQLSFVPVVTHATGDMLILLYAAGGLAVIALFRMEVFSPRPSATLLQLAASSAMLMVLVDAAATTQSLKALEYPFQSFACALLMLAFAVRWLEVRQIGPARQALEFCGAAS